MITSYFINHFHSINLNSLKFKYFTDFSEVIDLDVTVLKDIKHFIFGDGRLAQLVEHLVYTEGVKGSSPLLPTKIRGCSSVG